MTATHPSSHSNPTTAWALEHSTRFGQVAQRVSKSQREASDENKNTGSSTTKDIQHDDKQNDKIPLILHFDVNETILVGDEAGGDTVEDCLHKMLAKTAFCQVPLSVNEEEEVDTFAMEPTHWWNGQPICGNRDEYEAMNHDNNGAAVNVPPLYTGFQWPDGCVPYYRTKLRKIMGNDFCNHHGSIYQETLQALEEALSLTSNDNSSTMDSKNGPKLLPFLLPAFWETLLHLSQLPPSQPWTVVFRTFGSDLPDLCEALSCFARGQHPRYPDFCDERFVLQTQDLLKGQWVKKTTETQDGTTEPEGGDTRSAVDSSSQFTFQLQNADTGALLASGDDDILRLFQSKNHCVLGIADDYPFWAAHDKRPWAGKPIWQATQQHHLLFDDNIYPLETYSIANVRVKKHKEWECLPNKDVLAQHGRHLVRVPTVEPVLNPQWFWEQIQRSGFGNKFNGMLNCEEKCAT